MSRTGFVNHPRCLELASKLPDALNPICRSQNLTPTAAGDAVPGPSSPSTHTREPYSNELGL